MWSQCPGNEQTAVERTLSNHLLDLRHNPVDPGTQIDRPAGEEHLRPRCQADHVAPFIARSTRDSAFSLTNASTLTRLPFGRAISIPPALLSPGCRDRGRSGGGSIGGVAFPVSPNTPSGTNSTDPAGPTAAASQARTPVVQQIFRHRVPPSQFHFAAFRFHLG